MLSYTRRNIWRLVVSGWAAVWSERSFAQQKLPATELKVGIQLDDMSEAVRDSIRRRLQGVLVGGRYVRSIDKITAVNQSGPSTDPDYSEFWVQVVPKGSKTAREPIFANSDWSEIVFTDIKPSWDEMNPKSIGDPNATITLKASMGKVPLSPTLYRDLLDELFSRNPPK